MIFKTNFPVLVSCISMKMRKNPKLVPQTAILFWLTQKLFGPAFHLEIVEFLKLFQFFVKCFKIVIQTNDILSRRLILERLAWIGESKSQAVNMHWRMMYFYRLIYIAGSGFWFRHWFWFHFCAGQLRLGFHAVWSSAQGNVAICFQSESKSESRIGIRIR